jgi:hypothetical protein
VPGCRSLSFLSNGFLTFAFMVIASHLYTKEVVVVVARDVYLLVAYKMVWFCVCIWTLWMCRICFALTDFVDQFVFEKKLK